MVRKQPIQSVEKKKKLFLVLENISRIVFSVATDVAEIVYETTRDSHFQRDFMDCVFRLARNIKIFLNRYLDCVRNGLGL